MNQGSMKYWITIVLFVVITFPVISQQYRITISIGRG